MLMIATVDAGSKKEQRNAFTLWLRDQKVGFWHHLEYSWIISDRTDRLTLTDVRAKLIECTGGTISNCVLPVTPGHFAAFAPTDSHQWLHDNLTVKPVP